MTSCMYRSLSPHQSKLLASFIANDTFGAATAERGRMMMMNNSSASSCFVVENDPSMKTLLFPLQPSKGACNVYGSVHGGALWSFSDFASTLHLALKLSSPEEVDQHQQRKFEDIHKSIRLLNASCRYHNGVSQDSLAVCKTTIVSFSEKTAQFYVDLIPEKFAPLKFDEELKEWKVREDGAISVIPDSTFTRAVFTKAW